MKDIFEDVTGQFIDIYGKCRIINYSNPELSIVISPIPPLDVKQVTEDELILATSEDAVKFINNTNDVKIKEQDGNEENQEIQGIWIEHPSLQFGYIPITDIKNNAIKGVDFTDPDIENPIYTDLFT